MRLCRPCPLILVFHDVHPSVLPIRTHAHTHAHALTHMHALPLIGIQDGAQVGEALPIYEQRRKQARCVWLVHRWNECS